MADRRLDDVVWKPLFIALVAAAIFVLSTLGEGLAYLMVPLIAIFLWPVVIALRFADRTVRRPELRRSMAVSGLVVAALLAPSLLPSPNKDALPLLMIGLPGYIVALPVWFVPFALLFQASFAPRFFEPIWIAVLVVTYWLVNTAVLGVMIARARGEWTPPAPPSRAPHA